MNDGNDHSAIERELRTALAARANQIRPSNRLDEILRQSDEIPATDSRRWVAAAAVAAAAAVVAGVVWASQPDTGRGTLPAGTPTPSMTVPSPTPDTPTTTPNTTQPTQSPSTTTFAGGALAIYRVGTNGGELNRPGLVREFWSAGMLSGDRETARAAAAVREAMRGSTPWRDVLLTGVSATDRSITLFLSDPGRATSVDRARLDALALAWTAQAAVGQGDLPVRFEVDYAPATRILGQLDPDATYTRAATPPSSLTDLWIDHPTSGARLSAGRQVVVKGEAVAFEATVEWELRRGSAVVRDGFTTATIGAPSRGTFAVDLGALEPGSWSFRVFERSMEDGVKVHSERMVTFSVG